LNRILSPNCGQNQIDNDEWGGAVENWSEQNRNDNLKCSNCAMEFSIMEYEFELNWVFGNFGLRFWNWGEFKPDFIS